jgi:hypothetical protein
MAKQGGSLTADTNAAVLTADMNRAVVIIQNLSATDTIYFEFGAAASTTSTDDSFVLLPETTIMLPGSLFPEIRGSVNLKSTGTPQYLVRDSTL